jgi:serine/threonine-protein phosphatase PP1 catalytic subunit
MANSIFTSSNRYVYVAGDLHGDYDSFGKITRMHNKPAKDSMLLFLGDYADRGPQGVEIITELNSLIDMRDDIVALKGNHEIYKNRKPEFFPCNLINEAELKYNSWNDFYNEVLSVFLKKLHIAAVINSVLFIHAGIFSGITGVTDLIKEENERYLLWSDPSPKPGEHLSVRRGGVKFGEDVTERILSALDLKLIIRSHEPRKARSGPFEEHGGRIITTNACNSYGESWRPFILKVDTVFPGYETIYL